MRSSLIASLVVALGSLAGSRAEAQYCNVPIGLPGAQPSQQVIQVPPGAQLIQGADGRTYIVTAPVTSAPQPSYGVRLNPLTGQLEYYPINNTVLVGLPPSGGGFPPPVIVPPIAQFPGSWGQQQAVNVGPRQPFLVNVQLTQPAVLGRGNQVASGLVDPGLTFLRQ
jgi:hypothetical protein